jgi:hypothetical protein
MASIPTQEEILTATRKSQEAMIAALKSWLETVRTATPKLTAMYAPLTDKLPKLPQVSLPFADKLPTPEEAVASAYHTAEQLLANQRKFTEELLKAMTPLIPRPGESSAKAEAPNRSAWQEAVTTSEPKTVASAAPAAAPARPQATSTSATSTPPRPQAESTPATSTPPRPQAESTPAMSTPPRPQAESTPATSTPARPQAESTPATSTPARPTPRTAAAKRSTGTTTAAKTGTTKPGTSTAAKTGTSTAAKTGTSTTAKQAKASPAPKDADAS